MLPISQLWMMSAIPVFLMTVPNAPPAPVINKIGAASNKAAPIQFVNVSSSYLGSNVRAEITPTSNAMTGWPKNTKNAAIPRLSQRALIQNWLQSGQSVKRSVKMIVRQKASCRMNGQFHHNRNPGHFGHLQLLSWSPLSLTIYNQQVQLEWP